MKSSTFYGLCGLLLLLVLAVLMTGTAHAQDETEVPGVNTGFMVWCGNLDPAHLQFVVQSDGVEHYTVSTSTGAPQTIATDITTHAGYYLLPGEIDVSSLDLEVYFTRDDGAQGVMPIGPDYGTWCDHDFPAEDSPEPNVPSDPAPTDEAPQVQPIAPVYVAPVIQSTGRVCTVSYPSLAVVCH